MSEIVELRSQVSSYKSMVADRDERIEQMEKQGAPFRFDRYVNGELMAEEIIIERETTLDAAIKKAVRICPKRSGTVLVHLPPPAPAVPDGWKEAIKDACDLLRDAANVIAVSNMNFSTGDDKRDAFTPTHKHYKGGLYQVISEGRMEEDQRPVAIYKDADGKTWVRPMAEFLDKFTAIDAMREGE